ncbi:transposase, partial [Catenibacterium mitsuokai]|uniref:transposase n=4 Tax=Catenibacterium TaxID=135858 RepID=UPI003F92FC67
RYYYVLKKFNWLLFSTNNKIFDDNNEKKLNHVLNRYCNYSDLFTYMLSIDEELETASNLKDQVVYFYDHCNHDNAKKKLEEIIIDFRSCPVEEMAPFANTLTNWKNEIINSFIIVDDRSKRKMNTAIVENRNKTIKLIKHASNGYLNWERFRNRILYTLNDDTTYYFTCIRKDRN